MKRSADTAILSENLMEFLRRMTSRLTGLLGRQGRREKLLLRLLDLLAFLASKETQACRVMLVGRAFLELQVAQCRGLLGQSAVLAIKALWAIKAPRDRLGLRVCRGLLGMALRMRRL